MNKFISIFFMLIPLLSISQITIDSSHIVSIGEVRYFGDVENDADLFSIGGAGTNQTWNFSNLIAEEQDSIIVLNPQNTAYSFMFPTSNLCASGDILFYLENNWDGLWLLGGVDSYLGPIPIDKQAILKYPLTYGSSFTSKWEIDTMLINNIIPIPGIDIIRYKLDSTENNYVDGWGTLKLPMGDYDALRMKKNITSTDSVWGRAFPASITINTNGMMFSPDSIWVNIGDTVFFNTGGYHNAVQVDSTTWTNQDTTSNGGFFFPGNATANQYIIIDTNINHTNGIIYYVCQPHASMGMTGRLFINGNNPWSLIYNSDGTSLSYWWLSDHPDAGFTMLEAEIDDYGDVDYIRFMKQEKQISNINNINNNITVYPNPVSEKLFINCPGTQSNILIKNIIGQIIIETSFTNIIDIRKIKNGIYFIEIYEGNNLSVKEKIIIQH